MRFPQTFLLMMLCLIIACEQPSSPDFKAERNLQLPLISSKTYQFLGKYDALIDTTNSDFEDFFSTDQDGVVSLSKQEDFDFGSLDDAIPEVDVNPTDVYTTVGPITLNDFSSGSGNLGSAGFEEITGTPPGAAPQGSFLPGGSETVQIELNTDYLQSAVIEGDNGSVSIEITNDLGFRIDQITLRLLNTNTNTVLGSDQLPAGDNFEDDQTRNFEIDFSDGDVLEALAAEVDVSWNNQNTQDEPDELIVSQLQGQNITASQVTAEIESQDFNTNANIDIDDSNFQFNQADHHIELESGGLEINQIVNDIPLYVEPLVISFPGIRTPPYDAADSLVVRFEGQNRIPRDGSLTDYPTVDLTDARIYATNNQLEYNIVGSTENTQGTGDERTISSDDQVTASIEINNLSIKKAEGYVVPRNVIINDDDLSNGADIVDLFNDSEAETIAIDALEDLSDELDGIEFANPELSISYLTNIGVSTTIYASIVGSKPSGKRVFLRGLQGGPHYVSDTEIPAELRADGAPLQNNQLIKFTIDATQGGTSSDAVVFNRDQTNVDEFLNNLPSNIRFVGVAEINSDQQEGTISDPVEFDPSMSVDIPLNLSATNASYTDTMSVDMSDLPDPEEDDNRLTGGEIYIEYSNALPLSAGINLVMLDAAGNEVTTVPGSSQDALVMEAGQVSQSGFVSTPTDDVLTISLSEAQLDVLHETEEMEFKISLNTPTQSSIKVRDTDAITLKISMSGAIESTVN